jgi:hypothetical protein
MTKKNNSLLVSFSALTYMSAIIYITYKVYNRFMYKITLIQGSLTFLPSHLPWEWTKCSHLPSFPKLINKPMKTTIKMMIKGFYF